MAMCGFRLMVRMVIERDSGKMHREVRRITYATLHMPSELTATSFLSRCPECIFLQRPQNLLQARFLTMGTFDILLFWRATLITNTRVSCKSSPIYDTACKSCQRTTPQLGIWTLSSSPCFPDSCMRCVIGHSHVSESFKTAKAHWCGNGRLSAMTARRRIRSRA